MCVYMGKCLRVCVCKGVCVCVCVCKSAMGYTSLTNSVLTRIKLFIGEKALFCLCGSHACLLNGVLMFECPFFFCLR